MEKTILKQGNIRYNHSMKPIGKCLNNPALSAIQAKISHTERQLNQLENLVRSALPKECTASFKIIRITHSSITIESTSIWLMWLKGYEYDILETLKQSTSIRQVKWRVNTQAGAEKIATKNHIRLSNTSQKFVARAAQSIQHEGLKAALEKMANRSK